jgi:hypothetical protein
MGDAGGWRERFIDRVTGPRRFPAPGDPQAPVTLQVRQSDDGEQIVVLWVIREVLEAEGLTPLAVRAASERPMWLDVDTDIMGAAVVLGSVEVRVLPAADEG